MLRLRTRNALNALVASTSVLFFATSVHAIGISFDATSGGTLEDAILIASVNGAAPRDAVALGDFDLSVTEHVFDVPVDEATTHWWLIGHESGDVVYSSNLDLLGVEMYSIEPYDVAGAELAWNIPANLDGYVNGTSYSLDWWAATGTNHSSHVTADEGIASLWRFASPGHAAGRVAVSLHTNTPPPIPEPSIFALSSVGALGLLTFARRRRA